MANLHGVRFSGPLVPYAQGFADELERQGYLVSGAKGQLFLVSHLSRWLAGRGLEPAALGSEGLVEEFFAARRPIGYTNYRTSKALVPLLAYLRAGGVVALVPVVELTPAQALLERYRSYLTGERGLAASTARGYIDAVKVFVGERVVDDEDELAGLMAAEVTAFVVATCPGQARGSARMTVTALRSLLASSTSSGSWLSRWPLRSRPSRPGGCRDCPRGWRQARLPACWQPRIGGGVSAVETSWC